MTDAQGEKPKETKLDAEEIRRNLMADDLANGAGGAAQAPNPRFVLRSNEELRRLTAADLVESGKYSSIEEAIEDLKKFGF